MKKSFINKIKSIIESQDNDDIKFDLIVNTTRGLEVYDPKEPQDPKGGDNIMVRGISRLDNATDYPITVFIRHIEKGIAHYNEMGKTVLINDEALMKMKNSLCNKPIYVYHKDSKEDNIENLEKNSHGWIVDSFYNQLDGWWWCKAIIFTDLAKSKLQSGWKVSNSYKATEYKQAEGVYHNIPYQLEVKNGVYDHIAIVDNPRYEGVMILSPEEYKTYNQELELKLENSKKRKDSMFKFFKKQKVEATEDFSDVYASVDGVGDVKVADIIESYKNAMDKKEAKDAEKDDASHIGKLEKDMKEDKKITNAEEVEIDGKKVSMEELVKIYKAEKAEMKEKAKLDNEKKEEEEKQAEKLENSIKKDAEKENKHFENVQNAIKKGHEAEEEKVKAYETAQEKLERGKKY